MIKFIKTLKTREEYFAYPAVNTSKLKAFEDDPESIINPEELASKALAYGSAVDTLLFDGATQYAEDFFVMNCAEPTETSLKFANSYIESIICNGTTLEDYATGVQICKDFKYWANIKKEDTLIKKFDTPEVWAYIKAKIQSHGKIIIDAETGEKVVQSATTLRDHAITNKYFVSSAENETEVVYQLAIVFDYHGTVMKAMLDSVVIDNKRKLVCPTDTKTMGESAKKFYKNVSNYRYDLQEEIYSHAMQAWIESEYPGYKLTPFRFIVISKTETDKPYVYRMITTEYREKINAHRVKPMRGLDDILTDYIWHIKEDKYEYPREMYEKGYIEL